MCNYQGYEFGAGSYPDSVCIDGKLFDADKCDDDGNLYGGEDIPCPICNPTGAITYWYERNYDFIEEGMTEDESDAYAHSSAVKLVNDIRKNRGIEEIKND